MKVRFTGLEGHEQSVRQGADTLHQGRIYVVLEVHCQTDGPNYFRIEFRRGELPPLFDSRLFEVVDPEVHPSWTVSTEWDGSLTMAPSAWQVPGFWEEFMDHSPDAIEKYEIGRDSLMSQPE
ncbi:hypothetical protein [Streptomyces lavendofoliae]|uniref:Uncharacterized protein n=1 Tax=Streptomyces lavendofoliae TaxID=67314 RepID=A0A918I1T2_9ACTN|nr:hypothetical protein [Streptomyces lavendofoliae]GGU55828.1 hypothetical protein GCM10010274_51110 [Streptomyces lavendofoliae]